MSKRRISIRLKAIKSLINCMLSHMLHFKVGGNIFKVGYILKPNAALHSLLMNLCKMLKSWLSNYNGGLETFGVVDG